MEYGQLLHASLRVNPRYFGSVIAIYLLESRIDLDSGQIAGQSLLIYPQISEGCSEKQGQLPTLSPLA